MIKNIPTLDLYTGSFIDHNGNAYVVTFRKKGYSLQKLNDLLNLNSNRQEIALSYIINTNGTPKCDDEKIYIQYGEDSDDELYLIIPENNRKFENNREIKIYLEEDKSVYVIIKIKQSAKVYYLTAINEIIDTTYEEQDVLLIDDYIETNGTPISNDSTYKVVDKNGQFYLHLPKNTKGQAIQKNLIMYVKEDIDYNDLTKYGVFTVKQTANPNPDPEPVVEYYINKIAEIGTISNEEGMYLLTDYINTNGKPSGGGEFSQVVGNLLTKKYYLQVEENEGETRTETVRISVQEDATKYVDFTITQLGAEQPIEYYITKISEIGNVSSSSQELNLFDYITTNGSYTCNDELVTISSTRFGPKIIIPENTGTERTHTFRISLIEDNTKYVDFTFTQAGVTTIPDSGESEGESEPDTSNVKYIEKKPNKEITNVSSERQEIDLSEYVITNNQLIGYNLTGGGLSTYGNMIRDIETDKVIIPENTSTTSRNITLTVYICVSEGIDEYDENRSQVVYHITQEGATQDSGESEGESEPDTPSGGNTGDNTEPDTGESETTEPTDPSIPSGGGTGGIDEDKTDPEEEEKP